MKRRAKKNIDATAVDQEIDSNMKNGLTVLEGSEVLSSKTTSEKLSNVVDDKQEQVTDQESVNQYINNCRNFDVQIDPSVVISLKTGWDILQPSKSFSEGGLLPLSDILGKNKKIKKLYLGNNRKSSTFGNGNSNARILKNILKENNVIEEINFSSSGLNDDGISEISEGIKNNKTIKNLNLSYNNFGEIGAEMLCQAVSQNNSIRHLDLSSNALGFQSINRVLRICKCKHPAMTVVTHGNYVFEEILNSVTHGVCFLFSIVGALLLVTIAANEEVYSPYHFWSCVLYSFSLMFLFLSSCLFHSFFMIPQAAHILQILDHVGISMLIAGSYTPFLLIGSHHSIAARFLVIGEWISFAFHVGLSAISNLNAPATTNVELCIFVFMGVVPALFWQIITADLEPGAIVLFSLGGAAYLLGIPFFILGEVNPFYHVVWHLFVAAGSAFHWFLIYFFILNTDISLGENTVLSNVMDVFHNLSSSSLGSSCISGSSSNGPIFSSATCN